MTIRRRLRSVFGASPSSRKCARSWRTIVELRTRGTGRSRHGPAARRPRRSGARRRRAASKRALAALGHDRNRRSRRQEWLDEFRQDVRFALRQCRSSPASRWPPCSRWRWVLAPRPRSSASCTPSSLRRSPTPSPTACCSPTPHGADHRAALGRQLRLPSPARDHAGAARRRSVRELQSRGEGEPERVVGPASDLELLRVFGVAPALRPHVHADEDQPGAPTSSSSVIGCGRDDSAAIPRSLAARSG